MQVAEWQLFRAIDIFCFHRDPICAITLAGAAEEILGDMLKQRSHVTALDENVNDMCQMHHDSFASLQTKEITIGYRTMHGTA